MKKRILAVLLSVLLVTAMTGCGSKKEEAGDGKLKKITFVLDWTPNTNHTGIYVAKEKGYFKEAGLDVEIVQPPEDGAEVLVGSGKAQFGVSFQDTMMPAVVGDDALPIKAVAAVLQHNTSGIVSRKGEGINRPKGLEGKKYATWNQDIEKAILKRVVEKDKGNFSKVKMIPSTVTDEVSALKSKKVDAIWIYYGWAGIATEVAGLDTDYFAFKDIDPVFDYYTPVIIGNSDWMKENEETAKAFLSASKKGYEYAIEHPENAGNILCEASPELDSKMVQASQKYMKDQYKAEVEQWGYINPKRWNAFYDWISEKGLSKTKIPENTGFTNDYLE